jgi:hypothetical protein
LPRKSKVSKIIEKIVPVLTTFIINYNFILFWTYNSNCEIEVSIVDKNLTFTIFLQEWPEDDCMQWKHVA